MTLGKRGRPEMKRTTSMTEFTMAFNCGTEDVHQRSDPHDPFNGGVDQRYSASSGTAASPRPQRRSSADLVQTAHFLRVCSLCKRRLIPGRDIYMYRGDRAFCSLECRQQQMTQDETKEKCSLASKEESATTAGECFAAV